MRKKDSVLSKLLFGIIVPLIIILIVTGACIVNPVGNAVMEMSNQNLKLQSQKAAIEAELFFNKYISAAQSAAANTQAEHFIKLVKNNGPRMNQEDMYITVKKTLDKLSDSDKETILAVWIGDFESSQITQSDGFNSKLGWDITQRPWYAVAKTKLPVLTEPYIDASTGSMIVTASAPVFDSVTGEPIGAIGFDFSLDKLNKNIGNIKVGNTGFTILCSKDNQVVYHPNSDYIQKNIVESDLSESAKVAVKDSYMGNVSCSVGNERVEAFLAPVGETGWKILCALPESEYTNAKMVLIRLMVITFICCIFILSIIILLVARGIVKPLKNLATASQQIADGNLNISVDTGRKDEIGQVANAMANTATRLSEYINYIDELSSVLNQIAEGNLIFELEYEYVNEFLSLKTSINNISKSLNNTMNEINSASEQVANSSDQVSVGAQALAQGTNQQALSIEELSEAVKDISLHIKKNASNANLAREKTERTIMEVQLSNGKMTDMISAMNDISNKSDEISKIIKIIDDIAFQTNILALNATVEAARVGIAGKGFAVVADEVKNLAEKSAQAAKNTESLIAETTNAINRGVTMAADTAKTMLLLVEGSKSVDKLIVDISIVSNDQEKAIEHITSGIENISSVIQSNSATAEESAASSEELSGQAQMLKALVGKFKIRQ